MAGSTQSSPGGWCHRVSHSMAASDLGVTWGFGVEMGTILIIIDDQLDASIDYG